MKAFKQLGFGRRKVVLLFCPNRPPNAWIITYTHINNRKNPDAENQHFGSPTLTTYNASSTSNLADELPDQAHPLTTCNQYIQSFNNVINFENLINNALLR